MVVRRLLISAGLFLALAATAKAQNILYQHDFSGSAATPLHRQFVDIDVNGGGTTWVTRTDTGLISGTGREWYADGHIDTTIDPNVNGSASLGFATIAGNIYTLMPDSTRFQQWGAAKLTTGSAWDSPPVMQRGPAVAPSFSAMASLIRFSANRGCWSGRATPSFPISLPWDLA